MIILPARPFIFGYIMATYLIHAAARQKSGPRAAAIRSSGISFAFYHSLCALLAIGLFIGQYGALFDAQSPSAAFAMMLNMLRYISPLLFIT